MGKQGSLENKLTQRGECVSRLWKEGYSILIFSWLSALKFPGLVDDVREVIASGRRPLVFVDIHGKVQKRCKPSDLRKLGVQLPPDVANALQHDPTTAGAHFDLSKSVQFFDSSPDVSLIQIKENGSIEVAFPELYLQEGKWTIIDGLDMVRSGFEVFDQSPPDPPQTLQELDVVSKTLSYVTGYDWTRTDSMKLLSSAFKGFDDKLLCETYGADLDLSVLSSTPSTSASSCLREGIQFPHESPKLHQAIESLCIVTGNFDITDNDALKMLNSSSQGYSQFLTDICKGNDFTKPHTQPPVRSNSYETCIDIVEKNPGNESNETSTFSPDKSLKFLFPPFMRAGKFGYLFYHVIQILHLVGKNATAYAGTWITCFFGVGFPALQLVMAVNARDVYFVDYAKAIAYGAGCLSMMISWVFSYRGRGEIGAALSKEKMRLQDLGHIAAGWAFFSIAVGVVSNVFFCIPLPYVISCICSCMFLLIIAVRYVALSP